MVAVHARAYRLEYWALLFWLAFVLSALVLAAYDEGLFTRVMNQEDQLTEYLEFTILIALALVCLARCLACLSGGFRAGFLFYLLCGTIFLLFAGEEISWGQRLFGITTPGYFSDNNRQNELNFHNLSMGERQIADFIYIAAEIVMAVYLLVVPVLHRHSLRVSALLDRLHIPVPRQYVALVLVFSLAVSELLIDRWLVPGQGDELTEFSVMFSILMCFAFPANAATLAAREG